MLLLNCPPRVLQLAEPSSSLRAEREPFTFELFSDEKKQVIKASVTMQLDAEQSKASRLLSHNGRLEGIYPPAAYLAAVEQLQSMESNLSFAFSPHSPITRIRWDEPSIDLIPETDVEAASINTWNVAIHKHFPNEPCRIREQPFREMISDAPRFESVLVLKAFVREGTNEFRDLRFIQAFYNFYFVIEGLFANGKSRTARVLDEFRNSDELRVATKITLETFSKDTEQHHSLQNMLHEANCAFDLEGLWKFLIHMRGVLHHFSIKDTRRLSSPFSSQQFEKPALLAMLLAKQSIYMRIMTINGNRLGSIDSTAS